MSKIYETKQDLDRDIMASKIKDAHNSKKIFAGSAATFGLLSVLYFRLHELSEELLARSRDVKNLVLGNDYIRGWMAALGAVVSAGMVFASHREEYKLKKEAERLGRQSVIFPQDDVMEANPSVLANSDNLHVARFENSKKNLKPDSLSR